MADLTLTLIAGFLVVAFIVTFLIKRFIPGANTFFIGSMLRTQRFLPIMEKFAKHKKFVNFLSETGLVLGFGLFAVDFMYGRRMKLLFRLGLLAISTVLLYFFFQFFLAPFVIGSPLTKNFAQIFSIAFALFGFAGFAITMLAINVVDILFKISAGKQACPGVAPVIPGVEIPNVPIVIPLHAWISLVIILIIHEGFHGILARKEKIGIKSSGILLLGFLPIGAFVEPDEQQMKASSKEGQLRILSAGASANLFSIAPFFLISLAILSLIVVPFVSPWAVDIHKDSVSGVKVEKVLQKFEICGDEYPSDAYGKLQVGQIVKEVNGKPILLASDLQQILNNDPKELNFVVDSNGVASNVSLKANEIGGFGFQVKEIQSKEFPLNYKIVVGAITFFDSFMSWLILLSLLIALVNFLPMEPFDGGKIAKILFIPYLSFLNISDALKEKLIHQFFLIIVLSLFILNALPLFL